MKNIYDIKSVLRFLSDLSLNNNREWFNKNKDRYNKVKEEVETLTLQLITEISSFEPKAANLRPSDCLYRIYRDTRFSADKTPYKTHIGIYINPPYGKKAPGAGYYLHLEPGNNLVAGGVWCPDSNQLKMLRTDIYDNVDEYIEIIENPEFKKYFKSVGEDLLKTAPKGFPKDWKHIELLRPRSFTTYSPLSDEEVSGKHLIDEVVCRMKELYPLNRFYNYTIFPED